MKINGKSYHTIWQKKNQPSIIQIIDQRWLPHQFIIEDLTRLEDFEIAIRDMHVRGAPLIGSAAAFGMYIALLNAPSDNLENSIQLAAKKLKATRPTAVNLGFAVNLVLEKISSYSTKAEKTKIALQVALQITKENIEHCYQIGEHGLKIIQKIHQENSNRPVNILTHCNAGWMACIDYGTATAPIYLAHDLGIPIHVWVDETRPRNQGARITAFELQEHGIPHTVIPDNVGGHLMQHKMVDLCIVGSDRTTRTGDVANKIGTYLKALAAFDNSVPFYVALPSSSFDWKISDGISEIPIEERGAEEVKFIQGLHENELKKVLLTPKESPASNFAFDVTPAKYVTGLITERGISEANEKSLKKMFPEYF